MEGKGLKIQAIIVLVLVMLGGNVLVSGDNCVANCYQICQDGSPIGYNIFCLIKCLKDCHVTYPEISDMINGIILSRNLFDFSFRH